MRRFIGICLMLAGVVGAGFVLTIVAKTPALATFVLVTLLIACAVPFLLGTVLAYPRLIEVVATLGGYTMRQFFSAKKGEPPPVAPKDADLSLTITAEKGFPAVPNPNAPKEEPKP